MAELVSTVGGGCLEIELELEELYVDLDAAEKTYEPETFAGMYFKLSKNGPTIMLFSSGEFNITGANSIEGLHQTHEDFVSEIESLTGFTVPEHEFEVRNLVYRDELPYEIYLEKVALDIGLENVEYNPELFPGLIYRSESDGLILVFASGVLIATGIKQPEEAHRLLSQAKSKIKCLFEEA